MSTPTNGESSNGSTVKDKWHSASFEVPFLNPQHALIALQALQVDPEQNPESIRRDLSVQDNILHILYRASTVRLLRLGTNSFLSSLYLVIRTLEEFAPDPSRPRLTDEELEARRIEANKGDVKGIELRGDGKGAGSGEEVR